MEYDSYTTEDKTKIFWAITAVLLNIKNFYKKLCEYISQKNRPPKRTVLDCQSNKKLLYYINNISKKAHYYFLVLSALIFIALESVVFVMLESVFAGATAESDGGVTVVVVSVVVVVSDEDE